MPSILYCNPNIYPFYVNLHIISVKARMQKSMITCESCIEKQTECGR